MNFEQIGRGCFAVALDLVTGKAGKMKQRLEEISKLSGIPDKKDVLQIINASIFIAAGSNTKAELAEKIQEGHNRGLGGKSSTGDPEKDEQIRKMMRLALLSGGKAWRKRHN